MNPTQKQFSLNCTASKGKFISIIRMASASKTTKRSLHRAFISILIASLPLLLTACASTPAYQGAKSPDDSVVLVKLRPGSGDRLKAFTDAGDVFIHSISVDGVDVRKNKAPGNFVTTQRLLLRPGHHTILVNWGRDWNRGEIAAGGGKIYRRGNNIASQTFELDTKIGSHHVIEWVYVRQGGEPSTDGKFKLELRDLEAKRGTN